MYHIVFMYSSIDGYLGYFQFLAVMNAPFNSQGTLENRKQKYCKSQ